MIHKQLIPLTRTTYVIDFFLMVEFSWLITSLIHFITEHYNHTSTVEFRWGLGCENI